MLLYRDTTYYYVCTLGSNLLYKKILYFVLLQREGRASKYDTKETFNFKHPKTRTHTYYFSIDCPYLYLKMFLMCIDITCISK